jgi:hypothetical protein
LCSCV